MTQILEKNFAKNYDEKRLKNAVSRAACANRVPAGDADNLAAKVVAKLQSWTRENPEITSRELRLATAHALAEYDDDAAYLYENENKLF